MTRKITVEVIVFLYNLLFVYAAVSKLIGYERFIAQLKQSPLLYAYAETIVWVIPGLELGITLMFVFQRTRALGLYFATGLMVGFTAYILAILYLSPVVPCSCGGVLEVMGWKAHLGFNLGFVALGFIGIRLQQSEAANALVPET